MQKNVVKNPIRGREINAFRMTLGYSTFYSQIIRFSRVCNNFDGLKVRILFLFDLFVSNNFAAHKLVQIFYKCIFRYNLPTTFPKLVNIFK